MKTKLNNRRIILIVSILSILLAACVMACLIACENPTWIIADAPPATPSEIPPFVITKPVVEITERTNYFKCAGIVFKFLNNAEEPITKIKVSFMLFDTKTQSSPFIGSNVFEITKWEFVAPGENKEICISLDQFIYIAPNEPYLIDFFYVAEIHYTDENIWFDQYGKYRVRW